MRHALTTVLALQAAACSWSRFDDVVESPPVVMLDKPGSMTAGFGLSVLSATSGDQALLFVGGAFGVSSSATFDLGSGQSPDTDANDTDYCRSAAGSACFLGLPPAALERVDLDGEQHELCFALGLGTTPLEGTGL